MTAIKDVRGLSEGDRRSGSGVRPGKVEEIQVSGSGVRVRVMLDEGVTTDFLPWMTWAAGELRVWSPPTLGEQVLVLSPSGETHQGFVAPALFSQDNPAPTTNLKHTLLRWRDGGYIRYETDTRRLYLHAPCDVRIEGNLIVSGDVIGGGGALSLLKHKHPGIEPGGGMTQVGVIGGTPRC